MKELEEMKKSFDEFMVKAEQTLQRIKGTTPKPILDKEEKEYLEAVIRPFRIQIERIYKKHYYSDDSYDYLLFDARLHNNRYSFTLPYFEKIKKFKGMELDKAYTLEELGLFEGE